MGDVATETPAPALRLVCEMPNCGKDYKTKGTMKQHLRAHHKGPVSEIESPLGNFPSSNPVRVLFNDNDQPSTQGNSKGEVNSLKVKSIVRYKYGLCESEFNSNEEAILHIDEVHTDKTNTSAQPLDSAPPAPSPKTTAPPIQEDEEFEGDEQDEKDLWDALDFINKMPYNQKLRPTQGKASKKN